MDALRLEAARTRAFVAKSPKRLNSKGRELKSNVTDPDSAKMATNKGVIRGYAAQAAVDSASQVIIAADVVGSGSEQTMLAPMIQQAKPWSDENTLVTADAGYHSHTNVQQLHDSSTPALIADNQMRKRDERFESQDRYKAKPDPLPEKKVCGQPQEIKHFRPKDFGFHEDNTATCPAGRCWAARVASTSRPTAGETQLRIRPAVQAALNLSTCAPTRSWSRYLAQTFIIWRRCSINSARS